MQLEFDKNKGLKPDIIRIITHPEREEEWGSIRKAILLNDEKIVLIEAENDRRIPVKYDDIISIESEDRMCNVKLRNGKMLLLGIRLKRFEETNSRKNFIKINNSVIINTKYIASFQSSENARIEVLLKDGSVYFVNRYYIKKFKENL